ncbi:thiamine pyrophosphate-binding protein [Saccharopolyspora erythraea]|uniref:thiamine pyrophosphate-binding protein n=1 Tax=Saccharopolyspora erythraea TaxID=1836 RepID=UPI001BA6B15F|nr:thiamine pyrophosphate-binding protein [Saccharopolyspora erythraea]QUH03647.1 thiamine pyrophosphate-binding protein [Saccharopolyspora erythraea]
MRDADNGARTRVVDRIVDYLDSAGVRHVFGVHGANVEDLYDAIHRSPGRMRGVIAKHEFSAGAMADGYHRASDRLAVVATTSGGGSLNLVPALGEAYASGVPVLALIGQPPTSLEGRGGFQDQSGLGGSLDGPALFSTVSRFCERVDKPDAIADLLPRAVRAALREGGPAVLLLPKDVQQAAATAEPPDLDEDATEPEDFGERVWRVLEGARRGGPTLIVAGSGVVRANARAALARFARSLGAWVAVEPDAKDVFDNHHPSFVGVAGANGHPSVRHCLQRASTVILAGTRFPQVARAGLEDALFGRTIVCFDRAPAYVADELPALQVGGDLRASLSRATERLEGLPCARPATPPHDGLHYLPHERSQGSRIALREVVETIAAAVPAEATVVSDAGNTGCGVLHFLPAPARGRYLLALGMGGMGFSFGAGLGAAFATGERTYVLAGDGSFFMHGMEVHTAIEHDLPVTFVVFNNNSHAACKSREELFYDSGHTFNEFRSSDIGAGVSAMFPGLRATTVRGLEELRAFLAETGRTRAPCLVSVEMRRDEMPPYLPFVPAEPATERTSPK